MEKWKTEIMRYLKDRSEAVNSEVDAALRDAIVFGTGLLKVEIDGSIKHVTIDDAEKTIKFIKENTLSRTK